MSEYIFKLPDLGEGTVEAEIAEWMVKVGDVVQEEDTICSMLTDKAAVELTAPVSGRITSVAGEVGDTIAVGRPLIIFDTGAQAEKPEAAEEPETRGRETTVTPEATSAPTDVALTQADTAVKTSPSIRMRAKEAGIDLTQIPGTGPRGRILQTDFESFLARQAGQTEPRPAPESGKPEPGTVEISIIGLRRKIAQHLEQSNREVPHFSYVEEVDITELEALRRHLNGRKTAGEDKLTLLPFIGMALARVLPRYARCNAHYDKERNVLIQHRAIHLGVATHTDDGLKVPVVRNVHDLSLEEIAAEIRRVTEAARNNSASREDLSGSTITLTSLGKLGGIVSTPLINVPEVAIIGVNKAVQRPVVHDGHIAVRLIMNLSSSFDHRFIDGHDAASLIQALKETLEHPASIFMTG